jgi:hypothetical protein
MKLALALTFALLLGSVGCSVVMVNVPSRSGGTETINHEPALKGCFQSLFPTEVLVP